MTAYRIVTVEVSVKAGMDFEADQDAWQVAGLINEFLTWKNETKNRPFSIAVEKRNILHESDGRS